MGTPIIKHSLVKLTSTPAAGRPGASAASPRGARAHGRKEARLVEIDGAVRAIEITCACGDTTVVELAFDAPKAALPSKPAAPNTRPAGGNPA